MKLRFFSRAGSWFQPTRYPLPRYPSKTEHSAAGFFFFAQTAAEVSTFWSSWSRGPVVPELVVPELVVPELVVPELVVPELLESID